MPLRRNIVVVISFLTVAILVVGALAGALTRPATSVGRQRHEENGSRHGGSIERFHGEGARLAPVECVLPPSSSLQGNWTHGDYASSWATWLDRAPAAQAREASIASLSEAAHSSCGKPSHALKLKPVKSPNPMSS